jgi:predicted nucleic acid-binding protein
MPDSHLRFVFDSTALSYFARLDRLDLLEKCYRHQACTTIFVCDEIQRGITAGYPLRPILRALKPLSSDGWLVVVSLESAQEQSLFVQFSSTLGPGESSCLSVARSRGYVVVTDDLAARRAAGSHNIDVTGTIGILVRLVRERHVSLQEANDLLAGMIVLRYRSPVARLDDLV